ncbi:flagellar motor protein MotA [Ferrovibrio sp.]|uniref:flagellar motor protein MotA n=1 Tax=Ferrovibrio sp. TaxID=1917215 RepID=UPI0025C6D27B|nr:flagellar motor protein MotA [Ferrovibrio sp.]MBX3455175.1 flagellar motor protein MotA [Ferrovibrio sp.]
MTKPGRFLLRMVLFLAAVIAVVYVLHTGLERAFLANPALNGLICAVLLIGILFSFRQVIMLGAEARWLEDWRKSQQGSSIQVTKPSTLLAPLAKMLENRGPRGQLSAVATRALLDSVGSRLDEARDISRYFIGLMVFLGLLGTFWGLLETIGSVAETIRGLSLGGEENINLLFEKLKGGLEAPLAGMGLAFSSSMLGLAGSLVLGFLDLQSGQAQNRFYNDLEEWLAGFTRVGGGGPMDGDQSVPAYVQALLEQTADSLDNLQRTMARSEENRGSANTALLQLNEKLSLLTEQMRAEQGLLLKLTEHQIEMKPIMAKLAQGAEAGALDAASRGHLRNIDVLLARLLDDAAQGRAKLVDDMRAEIKLLSRTLAAMADNQRRS